MNLLEILKPLRAHAGTVRTPGLDDASLERLAGRFPELMEAAKAAAAMKGTQTKPAFCSHS